MRAVHPRRLLILLPLLAASLGGVWFATSRAAESPEVCLPADRACLVDALDAAANRGFLAQMTVLSDTVSLDPGTADTTCADHGFALGASSTEPLRDVTVVLSAASADLSCRTSVLTALLENWSTAAADDPGQLRSDAGSLIARCRASTDPLCGEAVATGVSLALPDDDAIRSCYRLAGEVRATCQRFLAYRFLDRAIALDAVTDPREALVARCDSWPVDGSREDCFAAVGPAIFASAFGSFGFNGPLDTTELSEARGFCERLGAGARACQEAVFRVPVAIGMVGAANSERRTAYCEVFDVALREECLTTVAGETGPLTPG
jgi:hypothetical protein